MVKFFLGKWYCRYGIILWIVQIFLIRIFEQIRHDVSLCNIETYNRLKKNTMTRPSWSSHVVTIVKTYGQRKKYLEHLKTKKIPDILRFLSIQEALVSIITIPLIKSVLLNFLLPFTTSSKRLVVTLSTWHWGMPSFYSNFSQSLESFTHNNCWERPLLIAGTSAKRIHLEYQNQWLHFTRPRKLLLAFYRATKTCNYVRINRKIQNKNKTRK